MIVMHYAFSFQDPERLAETRHCVAARAPLLRGLAAKVVLLDKVQPCYAFYDLWSDTGLMLEFIKQGPLSGEWVDRFGQPEISLYVTKATYFPFQGGDHICIGRGKAKVRPGSVTLVDYRFGEVIALNASAGRKFEVLYVAGRSREPDKGGSRLQ